MSSLLTKSKTILKIYDTSLQFTSKLSDRSWMTLDLLAWLANEISIMMKGCIEEKPQATCDRLPDSPFKLPRIYSRNMEYFTFHNHYQLSSLHPLTLKNIISKRTFSILISIHLLWYYTAKSRHGIYGDHFLNTLKWWSNSIINYTARQN